MRALLDRAEQPGTIELGVDCFMEQRVAEAWADATAVTTLMRGSRWGADVVGRPVVSWLSGCPRAALRRRQTGDEAQCARLAARAAGMRADRERVAGAGLGLSVGRRRVRWCGRHPEQVEQAG
ncbi:MAG: hypothetical protein IT373_34780 [Polyangiaceae bacterium]|nr:hypothetical protein [Polyangiaceae bacterium]